MCTKIALPVLLLSSLWLTGLHAAIYKHIADDGTVFYSDKPLKQGDKKHESQPLMEFKPKTPPKQIKSKQKKSSSAFNPALSDEDPVEKKKAKRYQSINISSPSNDTAVRANDGVVTVQVALQPALQVDQQHSLIVTMDGSQQKQSTSNSVTFENVDRGTHQFSAAVVDNKGTRLLSSSAIQVHIQRHSVLHRRKAR